MALPEVDFIISDFFTEVLNVIFNAFTFYFLKAVDFVDKLLRYDHQERPTAKEAMVKPSPQVPSKYTQLPYTNSLSLSLTHTHAHTYIAVFGYQSILFQLLGHFCHSVVTILGWFFCYQERMWLSVYIVSITWSFLSLSSNNTWMIFLLPRKNGVPFLCCPFTSCVLGCLV